MGGWNGARCAAEAAAGRVTTALDALVRLTDEAWRRYAVDPLGREVLWHPCRGARHSALAPGAIVTTGSICGLKGCTGHPHYWPANAGIIGFTKAVAKELIQQGTSTPFSSARATESSQGHLDERRRAIAPVTPAGRLGRPEEMAATVAFLASDDAGYVVGATLSPNGGLVAY
jgi:3-oxoacyl-[acyl-carrier protein] reductase